MNSKSKGTTLCTAVSLAFLSACLSGQPRLEREVSSDEITADLLDTAPIGTFLIFPNGMIYEKDSDNYFGEQDGWLAHYTDLSFLFPRKAEELAEEARSNGATYLQYDGRVKVFQPGSRQAFMNRFTHGMNYPLKTPAEKFDRATFYRVQHRGVR